MRTKAHTKASAISLRGIVCYIMICLFYSCVYFGCGKSDPLYQLVIALPDGAKFIRAANIQVNAAINGKELPPVRIGYDPESVLKKAPVSAPSPKADAVDLNQHVIPGKNAIHFVVNVHDFAPKEYKFPEQGQALRGFRTACLEVQLLHKGSAIKRQTVEWTIIDMGGWGPVSVDPEQFDFEFEAIR